MPGNAIWQGLGRKPAILIVEVTFLTYHVCIQKWNSQITNLPEVMNKCRMYEIAKGVEEYIIT